VENVYYLFVVDDFGRLVGVISMKDMILESPERKISDIMNPEVISVHVNRDQEEVAQLIARYNVPSLPVVTSEGKLIGRITFDDVMDVVEAEATEDILKFGGAIAEEQLAGEWHQAVRNRLPWLTLNMLTAAAAATVVLLFADTIADELAFTRRAHALPPADDTALLQTLGLNGMRERYPRDLSAGERQRVALAAVLVSDPALVGADSQAIARVLAAAIQKMGDVDLVFFGRQAIDGDMGVTSIQTGRALGWPVLSLVSVISNLDPGGQVIRVERSTEEGRQIVETKLPAVVNVVKDIGEPRYPSFMGIRKASRATIPSWSLGDLGIEAPASAVKWPELENAPVREVQTEMINGDSPQEIADKLADKILAEKVL